MSDYDFADEFAQTVWQDVQTQYEAGYIPNEATLQACLFADLRVGFPFFRHHKFPRNHIVANPTVYPDRENDRDRILKPDLMVVNEAGEITDMFELKFVPEGYVEWKGDIDKWIPYLKTLRCQVETDPESGQFTGKWHKSAERCSLHFVAVAQPDAEALCTETIRNYINGRIPGYPFYHWKGPSGPIADRQWTIEKVQCR